MPIEMADFPAETSSQATRYWDSVTGFPQSFAPGRVPGRVVTSTGAVYSARRLLQAYCSRTRLSIWGDLFDADATWHYKSCHRFAIVLPVVMLQGLSCTLPGTGTPFGSGFPVDPGHPWLGRGRSALGAMKKATATARGFEDDLSWNEPWPDLFPLFDDFDDLLRLRFHDEYDDHDGLPCVVLDYTLYICNISIYIYIILHVHVETVQKSCMINDDEFFGV